MAKTNTKVTKKRKVVIESSGEAHISATFNNIIISLTNKKGDVISWSSAGKMNLLVFLICLYGMQMTRRHETLCQAEGRITCKGTYFHYICWSK